MNRRTFHAAWIASAFAVFFSLLNLFNLKKIMAQSVYTTDSFQIISEHPIEPYNSTTEATEEKSILPPTITNPSTNTNTTTTPVGTSSASTDPSSSVLNNKQEPLSSGGSGNSILATQTTNMNPSFTFSISSGQKVYEKFEIKGKVKIASGVEFYAIKDGSIDPKIYLGSAEKIETDTWSLIHDFSGTPLGKYKIIAKIKNEYGSYESGNIIIEIFGLVDKTDSANSLAAAGSLSKSITNVNDNDGSEKDSGLNKTETSQIRTKYQQLNETAKNIVNNSSLTSAQKRIQLKKIEEEKNKLRNEFIQRQEAERIFAKDQGQMTSEEIAKREEMKAQLKEDSDVDGIPDYEEDRIGSDPFSADTDQDGYLDGDEVKSGFDPLLFSSGDKSDRIVFEEPKEKGKINDFYEITKVDYKKPTAAEAAEGIELSGKALPNSFITLYIYSSPIVVTVKADEDGNWYYLLDKEIEDGQHQVYAAVTDNTGKITAKSSPLAFIKTAQAVTKIDTNAELGSQLQTQIVSPMDKGQVKMAKFVFLISLASLLLALISMGLFARHHLGNSAEENNLRK
jgi:hypothetical protein